LKSNIQQDLEGTKYQLLHFVLDCSVANPCLVPIAGQDPESFPRTLVLAWTTTLDSLLPEAEDLEIEQTRNVDY
jgi:hypothetical protein